MIKIKEKKLTKYFFFSGWIFLWSTLSFNPETFEIAKIYNFLLTDYNQSINLLRGSSTIFFGILVALLLIFNFSKIKFFEKRFILFYLFILIFFLQTIPYYKLNLAISNLYFLLNSILALIILIFIIKYFSEEDLKVIMYINFFFLIIICLYFGSKYLINFFYFQSNFYSLWGKLSTSYMNLEVPRPTGLSRSFLMIFIFISYINFEFKKFYIFKKIIQIISIVFIILLSSRSSIFLLGIIILLDLFWINRNKINFFETIIYKLIFPIIIISLLSVSKNIVFEKFKVQTLDDASGNSKIFSSTLRNYMPRDPDKPRTGFSSGRVNDWKNIIKLNKNFFLGNGVMGDRFLISQSASNGILYTYASAGLIGAFLFIFLSISILLTAFKLIFINHLRDNNLKFISAIFLIIIIMRSLLETSYAVFGLDYLIFSSSLAVLIKFKN